MMSSRIAYIDYAKAIAIILMVLGHCYWKDSVPYLSSAIYSFHMPLFFIMSGYFIKPLNIQKGLIKYARCYLWPYMVTCLVTLILIVIVDVINGNDLQLQNWLLRSFFASGSDKGTELFASTPIVGPLWFLFALFWSALIYSYLKNRFSGFDLLASVIFMFVLVQMSIAKIRLPFSVQAGFSSVLFLYVGDMLRRSNVIGSIFKERKFVFMALSFVWCICILCGSVSVSHCVYGLGLISVIGAIAGSILILDILCASSKCFSSLVMLGGVKLDGTPSIFFVHTK